MFRETPRIFLFTFLPCVGLEGEWVREGGWRGGDIHILYSDTLHAAHAAVKVEECSCSCF